MSEETAPRRRPCHRHDRTDTPGGRERAIHCPPKSLHVGHSAKSVGHYSCLDIAARSELVTAAPASHYRGPTDE